MLPGRLTAGREVGRSINNPLGRRGEQCPTVQLPGEHFFIPISPVSLEVSIIHSLSKGEQVQVKKLIDFMMYTERALK